MGWAFFFGCMLMDTIEQNLKGWKSSLMHSIPVAGLISRNPVAYKWKSTFRCWMVREAVFWRLNDLMEQSYTLHRQDHALGARILLRSGFETLATLIYLNATMQQVLDGHLSFDEFGDKTSTLLLGSRNMPDGPVSLNVFTVIQKCDKQYPGLERLYASLSESAHPSYEGLCKGYSKIDHVEFETKFSNRWSELFSDQHLDSMELCMATFQHEYDEVWSDKMTNLENWIESNDERLEATKLE